MITNDHLSRLNRGNAGPQNRSIEMYKNAPSQPSRAVSGT